MQTGHIYVITNALTKRKYVGQTSRPVNDRYREHLDGAAHYQRVLENPDRYSFKGTCTYLYKSMNKYGAANFSVEHVHTCPLEVLDAAEIEHIERLNTLAPNGYNLTTGGGHFQHCEYTKNVIREKVKHTMITNIDKFRSSEHTRGMPPYVAYKRTETYEAYYVNNHPLCKRKYFSSSTHGTIEAAKNACVEFITTLNTAPENVPQQLPKGLRTLRYGYRVRKSINGVSTEQNFNDKKLTREQNLENALTFLKTLNK